MKSFYRFLLCSAALIATAIPSGAEKKPLDHSVYDSWQRVGGQALSADGTKVAYEVLPQEGDGVLYIKDLKTGEQIEIERGSGISMTADSKWAFCRIKAPFQATRKAKIAKKKADQMPKDTLAYIDLTTMKVEKIADFTNYRVCKYGPYFTYETNAEIKEKPAPADTAKKAPADTSVKKKPSKPAPAKKEKVLVFVNPDGFRHDTLRHVSGYSFSRAGDKMAVVFKKDKKDTLSKDEVCLYRLPSMEKIQLAEGKKFYSTPEFNAEGDRFVMLASNDSNETGTKNCSLILGSDKVVGKGKKATRQVTTEELEVESPLKGWVISTGSAPKYSTKSDRIYLDLRDYQAPKDTSIIEFEAARLDLWSWDIYTTPPMYKASRNKVNPLKAVINLDGDRKVHAIATGEFERVSLSEGGEGKYALVCDPTPYMIAQTWDQNRLYDIYLVNLEDGSRETIRKAMNGGPGLSPEGKYIYWYSADDLGYHVMDLATRTEVNVTAPTGVNFYNEEDDHPDVKPQTDGAHWLEGDEAFLMADMYDMWKFTPDGKKRECLTKGEGRRNNRVYRYIDVIPNDWAGADGAVGWRRVIGRKELVYMSVFDRTTKGYGYATMKADQAGLVSEFVTPNMYPSFFRAYNVDVFAYQKGDCVHPNDLYVSDNLGVTEQKLSAINPQQAEYNWCNVQLVKWKAYDGTELEGLLYTPEDLDPAKKYPMMCYFYEKNSQTLHQYYSPAPSRSIVCIPFYASRGYVVFVPDIVYKDGHPGESAYNCICAGAEAMCEQFSFIDKDRMAIQGQSWGGYQTAYLVTRTDMFAAAGSGAPVGNMTSAYGGIRWGSGAVRAMQYEHGQSRIGKSMWEEGGLDLYIENSPVFHTQNVTTPVLIMHNDNDGAVPWYQGIEFFMALRRFGKPAWLLEYNGEAHNLVERRNCKDLSIRLQQFFDHYLKDEPLPAWMVTGIPGTRKGQYYGFEQAEQ